MIQKPQMGWKTECWAASKWEDP